MNKYITILIFLLLPANLYFFGKTLNYYFNLNDKNKFLRHNYESYVNEYTTLNRIYKKSNPIVFAGDSIMRRYAVEEYFPMATVVNRGIFHDTSAGLFDRWNSTVSTLSPELSVVMIGTNDILNNREKFIIQNIKKILDNATPNSIIVLSIPPFGSIHCEHNTIVLDINIKLKTLVESKNQYWVDVYSDLSDKNGCLSQEFSADGIHLNGMGYSILTSRLKKLSAVCFTR
jgi:hypothetical protein